MGWPSGTVAWIVPSALHPFPTPEVEVQVSNLELTVLCLWYISLFFPLRRKSRLAGLIFRSCVCDNVKLKCYLKSQLHLHWLHWFSTFNRKVNERDLNTIGGHALFARVKRWECFSRGTKQMCLNNSKIEILAVIGSSLPCNYRCFRISRNSSVWVVLFGRK